MLFLITHKSVKRSWSSPQGNPCRNSQLWLLAHNLSRLCLLGRVSYFSCGPGEAEGRFQKGKDLLLVG